MQAWHVIDKLIQELQRIHRDPSAGVDLTRVDKLLNHPRLGKLSLKVFSSRIHEFIDRCGNPAAFENTQEGLGDCTWSLIVDDLGEVLVDLGEDDSGIEDALNSVNGFEQEYDFFMSASKALERDSIVDELRGIIFDLKSIKNLESNVNSIQCADDGNRDDGDGLFENDRILVWGGVRFSLTPNQTLAFQLLVRAFPGDVTLGAFEEKGLGVFRDSFRFNRQGKKKYYPCWGLITDGSVKDSKRLIDPGIVRSDPKKFSDPQHNPQESPR